MKIQQILFENKGLVVATLVIGLVGFIMLVLVVAPAFKDPKSRMYTSSLGYGAMKRRMNMPFDVKVARVKRRQITIPYLGEGIISGEPIRVPIIPLATIEKVHVKEGDHVKKGDILMELDKRKALRNLDAAELAFDTVKAELRRVKVGSAYVLAQERPEQDRIELTAAGEEVQAIQQKIDSLEDLLNRGIVPRVRLSEARAELSEARARVELAQFAQGMSEKGVSESLLIAKNAVEDASQNLKYREAELDDYTVCAPRDGLISAVLSREGEFNQDIGKPAFLLTSGMWFEGYFDQGILGRVKKGQSGSVYLEAFPGHQWHTTVEHIIPQVTFATGGPEINRPLRPRGTGAPEWAATFSIRFRFEDCSQLSLGMTGNIKLEIKTDAVIVHRNALLSIAAGRAIVIQPGEQEGSWKRVAIETGYIGHEWVEVKSGLEEGDQVFVDGHRILRENDTIKSEMIDW